MQVKIPARHHAAFEILVGAQCVKVDESPFRDHDESGSIEIEYITVQVWTKFNEPTRADTNSECTTCSTRHTNRATRTASDQIRATSTCKLMDQTKLVTTAKHINQTCCP